MVDESRLPADQAASANWAAFQRADRAGHSDYVREAKRFNEFYLGEQWTEEDKNKLKAEGRPFLTLNQIFQVVNSIYGHYSQTRADVRLKPKRGVESYELAEVGTRMLDHIYEVNNYHEQVEPQVVMDGMIEDRGFFDVRMDFTENVLGDCTITSLDPRSVVLDPDAKEYDPATWSEVTIDRWLSLDDIELYYGKEARDRLDIFTADPTTTYGHKSVRYETYGDDKSGTPVDQTDMKKVKSIRVLERQFRKLGQVREFVHLPTGRTRPVPEGWNEQKVKAIGQAYNLVTRKQVKKRIRWVVSADRVVLHDDWSPYDDFTPVPFFPIFRRGNPSGIVRHLIDPQEQLNKIESQILHIINTTANSGWVVEAGSLANMDVEDLEEHGSQTGVVIEYKKNAQAPAKIQPNQIPTGLEQYAAKSKTYISDIPGASALLGLMPNTEVSGVALQRQAASALQGLKIMQDNLALTRKLVAQRVLSMVQTFYTEPRVYYVTQWRDPSEPVEQVAINQKDAAGQLVNNVTAGTFQVVISQAPARDTFQDQQFAESLELKNAGIPIPAYHIILHSRLHGKERIAEEVKQLEGLGEPGPMEQQMQMVQIRRALAELEKLEAEVAKIKSEAGYNQVRSQTELADSEREKFEAITQHERELARLRADLTKHFSGMEKDLQLAQIHTNAKQAVTRYTTISDLIDNERERAAQMQREEQADQRAARQRELQPQE